MKKQQIFLSGLLMLMGVSMANADDESKAYVSVQQNDVTVTAVGTAAFDLSKSPSVKFVNGKAVMTIEGNQVAVLPMSDGGQLAVELNGTASNVSKTLTDGFATIYSPFQLQVPSTGNVEVYAPTYEAGMLKLNDATKVQAGAIIPAGTGLILKNNGTIDFTFSADAATDGIVSDLCGSAQTIEKPVEEGMTVYTLGYNSTTNEYGFFPYNGENMIPGSAYLLVKTLPDSENENYVSFNFVDDDVTAVSNVILDINARKNGKIVENGRVIIVKDNKKYNLNGQEVK